MDDNKEENNMNENNEQKPEEVYTIQDASLEERLAANNTPVQTT